MARLQCHFGLVRQGHLQQPIIFLSPTFVQIVEPIWQPLKLNILSLPFQICLGQTVLLGRQPGVKCYKTCFSFLIDAPDRT